MWEDNHVWVTIVDRDGKIESVCYSGDNRGSQWPGGRIISAQKAYTANAFSSPGSSMSTANLRLVTGSDHASLGVQSGNPLDVTAAYKGPTEKWGEADDPMCECIVGGYSDVGGGLALYNGAGHIVGGIGVSGNTSGIDHNLAWKIRHALELDYVPYCHTFDESNDNIMYSIEERLGLRTLDFTTMDSMELLRLPQVVSMNLARTHPNRRVGERYPSIDRFHYVPHNFPRDIDAGENDAGENVNHENVEDADVEDENVEDAYVADENVEDANVEDENIADENVADENVAAE